MHPDSENKAGRPELAKQAMGGFMWLSAANGVRAVLKVAFLAILARLLTPAEFGVLGAAMVVVWLSMLITTLGVGPALVQRRTLEERHIATALVTSIALGATLAIVVWQSAPVLGGLLGVEEAIPLLRVLALAFPIGSLATVAECLLQRNMRFRAIATAELISYAVGYGAVGVTLAWMDYGVWALVAAEMSKLAIKSVAMLFAVPESLRFRFDTRAFAELFHFGSGYTITSITTYLAMQGDKFVTARFLGAASLGIYARAYELMMVPAQALGVILEKVLFPTLSRLQGDLAGLRTGYRRGMALVALLVMPISMLTIILAPEIVRVMLGDQWSQVVLPLRILAVAMYFRVGYMVGQSVANATGAVHRLSARNSIYAVLVVAGALAGYRWGLGGLAAGIAVAISINFLMVWRLASSLTGLPLRDMLSLHLIPARNAMLAGIVAEAMAVPLRAAGTSEFLVLVACLTAVFVIAAVALRLAPVLLLGKDGNWFASMLLHNASVQLRPYLLRLPFS
ncbi:MAG TPA: lipopolysaccharide biosynthesis protein [Gemmatimonadales bacterium]|nr:lipopolysaccharide biosynthesis protein [Gemmatimonadales bacterium]